MLEVMLPLSVIAFPGDAKIIAGHRKEIKSWEIENKAFSSVNQ